ncbi:hypothetical protein K443DRAFT_490174, partial [Laccaria amethystina LaAM-08-1]
KHLHILFQSSSSSFSFLVVHPLGHVGSVRNLCQRNEFPSGRLRRLLSGGRGFDWAPRLHEFIKQRPSLKSFFETKSWQIELRGSVAEIRIPYATYLFSFSSLQPFQHHFFLQSTPRLASSWSNRRQCLKAPILPFVFVPTPIFKSATNSVPGIGLLGGGVRHRRFASSRPR